jgi:SAM-dependent methyltransferase
MEKYGKIHGESADLGCGDGTMSFIMAGGVIHDYDVFLEFSNLDKFNDGADLHDTMPSVVPDIDGNSLAYSYGVGFDHKQSLVDKAARFDGLYRKAVVHDLNQPLPVDGATFDSAFSNILYWLNDLDPVLSDWGRVLCRGGRLHLFVPSANFQNMTWLYNLAPHAGERRYLNFLDRGYAGLIHHCLGTEQWVKLFEKAGFSIKEHRRYLSDPVLEIWNIGTRPIAPLLVGMSQKLTKADRAWIKSQWVTYFKEFFTPIVEGEFDRPLSEEKAGFHFFVLEKP